MENLIHVEKDMYCLNDIAEKLILSKNIKEYMKKIKNKQCINGNYYITKDDMKNILIKSYSKLAIEYLKYINDQDNQSNKNITNDNKHKTTNEELKAKLDSRKFIDFGTNEIIYNNSRILYFEYNDTIYFKAKDICELLDYSNTNDAIIRHIDKEDILTFNNLEGKGDRESRSPIPHDPSMDIYINLIPTQTNKDIENIKRIKEQVEQKINKIIDPHTIFINESGLYSLILSSKMPEAKKFKHWVTNDVLVSIRKTGSYNRVYNGTIYDEVKLKELENVPCVYIIHVKDSLYKFGQTRKSLTRMKTHKNNLKYSEIIKIYEMPSLDIAVNIENKIKKYTLNAKIKKNIEEGIEFFEANKDYPIERILEDINLLIDNEIVTYDKKININKLDTLSYLENLRLIEYDKLCVIDIEKTKHLELEKEIKQIELQTKQVELEILRIKEKNNPELNIIDKDIEQVYKHARPKVKKCNDCEKMISEKSTRCKNCVNKLKLETAIRENNRPSLQQLQEDIRIIGSYRGVGYKYNVSDNTIRNWIKQYQK